VASNFPTSLDDANGVGSGTGPVPATTDTTDSPSHAALHQTTGDAVVAVESKVGTGASTPTAGTVLTGDGSGTSSWGASDKMTEQFVTFVKSGNLATGTGTFRFYAQYALTLKEMEISVATAPTGAAILADLNKNGTTVFSTQSNRPTVAVSGNVGTTTTFNTTTLADGDYLTVDIDQVGSTVTGADLVVVIRYDRTA